MYMFQGDNGKYYVGSAKDIDRRIAQHNSGHTYATARMGYELVFLPKGMTTVIKARMIKET